MRERLALAFVLLAVSVLLLAGTVRALTIGDLLRDQEVRHLRHETELIAAAVATHADAGMPVDEAFLEGLVGPDRRLEYAARAGGEPLVVAAPGFVDQDLLSSVLRTDLGTLTLAGPDTSVDTRSQQLWALSAMVALISVLAALAGWWAARRLAAPFRELAGAAAALGRGRFDLQLPDTRIPEARAIGQALKVSAAQLESRLSRESDFAEYASHELRTPLTSLRFELEELTLRSDVPDDVKAAAGRCMARVDAVTVAVEELVALSRRGVLVEGGQVMLGELATQITQAWSDRLSPDERVVTARAEGELDQFFTPGPVEQILEVVLDDVARGEGPVRLVFEGTDIHVRIVVPAGVAGDGPMRGLEIARGLALPQGGRIMGDLVDTDLEILMPRR